MKPKIWLVLALALMPFAMSACGPVVGAGAVVAADKVAEEEDGDDGLF